MDKVCKNCRHFFVKGYEKYIFICSITQASIDENDTCQSFRITRMIEKNIGGVLDD